VPGHHAHVGLACACLHECARAAVPMRAWLRSRLDEMEELLTSNRIWKERTVDVGTITAQMVRTRQRRAAGWAAAGRHVSTPRHHSVVHCVRLRRSGVAKCSCLSSRRPGTGAARAPSCAPPASTGTCARRSRMMRTARCSSTCPSRATATATTATSCACRQAAARASSRVCLLARARRSRVGWNDR
jgi:hypothetical protein